jgi:N-acetyl sugar amidotransferase
MQCSFCVMDSSLGDLQLDASGRCICCRGAVQRRLAEYFPNEAGARMLTALASKLRVDGRKHRYDAVIGLSGGVDSAYLAHLMRAKFGLRLLAVHVDAGWNTEAAVHNIEALVKGLCLDLHTEVIEWGEMRDLQVSFLRSGVYNQDIPQDHAFFASLVRVAKREGLRHFLSGVNFASECVSTLNIPSNAFLDARHIRSIHHVHGSGALKRFPLLSIPSYLVWARALRRFIIHKPLNYLPYDKALAAAELKRIYNWKDYGEKHAESRFTKFYQSVYLPVKFGFDKRRMHLSSLIVAGQISRAEALQILAVPLCDQREAQFQSRFVAKKLGISIQELEQILAAPASCHELFAGDQWVLNWLARGREIFRSLDGFAGGSATNEFVN